MSTIDHRDEILKLPIAIGLDRRKMYHGLEYCKANNVVVIYDDQARGWMRGKEQARYGVMVTYSDIKTAFPAGLPLDDGIECKQVVLNTVKGPMPYEV